MSYSTNGGPQKPQRDLTGPIIGALAVIIAAVISALIALAAHSSGSSNASPPSLSSPTASSEGSSQASAPSAAQPSSPQSPPARSFPSSPTPAVSPLSTNIPILKPTSDPGFNLVWSGKLAINAAGLRISSSGVYPASPEDWDLAYQSGGDDVKWRVNNQTSEDPAIFSYTGSGTPGPAWCRRAFTSDQLTGTGTAEPGDKDCYIDLHGIVGYFQVISVGSDGPIVTAWFWNGPPP
jgi:hypothetical protein